MEGGTPGRAYPIFLDLKGIPVLVVGGGRVGARKAATLWRCGAQVTVVSPTLHPSLRDWAGSGKIRWEARVYRAGEAAAYRLVFAATGDPGINEQVALDTREAGGWVNVADRPELGNFAVPASFERGPLTVAVSTEGGSPWLARRFRLLLEQVIDPAYEPFVEQMVEARRRLRSAGVPEEIRKRAFEELWQSELLDRWRAGDREGAEELMGKILGKWEAAGGANLESGDENESPGGDPDPVGDGPVAGEDGGIGGIGRNRHPG